MSWVFSWRIGMRRKPCGRCRVGRGDRRWWLLALVVLRRNIAVLREILVDGRKISASMAFANRQAIDFLGHIGHWHGHSGFVGAHRSEVQILLQPAQREVRLLVISAFDALAFGREEWSGGGGGHGGFDKGA